MKLSKKCQYALKALFELAWRNTSTPVKTSSIAEAQQISLRFTEIILNELKHGGFVNSKRGNKGGYVLVKKAKDLTIGEVIQHIQGTMSVVPDIKVSGDEAFLGNEAFRQLWDEVNKAVYNVFVNKTFDDLIKIEQKKRELCIANYCI